MDYKKYFEDISIDISNAKNIQQALEMANLNYKVEAQNIYLKNGNIIPNKFANVLLDNNQVLGIVGKNYNITQNLDSFSFVDALISLSGLEFANAGALNDNNGAFILLKHKPVEMVNSMFNPYILITNNFDGSGAIGIEFTILRDLCDSVVLLTDKNIEWKFTLKHCKNAGKDFDVNNINNLLEKYIKFLEKTLNDLYNKKTTDDTFNKLLKELIPIDDKLSNILKLRYENMQKDILEIYNTLEIENNAYKIILAVAIYESHRIPLRDTGNNYIYMDRVRAGMELTNNMFKIIKRRIL